MRTIKEIITDIDWQVWHFDPNIDRYEDYHSLLRDNPSEIAPIIRNYCEIILKSEKQNSEMVRNAIENIEKYVCPVNRTIENSRLRGMPKYTAIGILGYINELIDICNSEECGDLQELNSKWKDKWLFLKVPDENPQVILINNIHYIHEQLAFNGIVISLLNHNGSGSGIQVLKVKDYPFANCNIDTDNEDTPYEGWTDPKELNIIFSRGPLCTSMKSRVLTDSVLKTLIDGHLYDEEYGCLPMLGRCN